MLVNSQNKPVKISDKLNSKTHPQIFANLHEKKEPTEQYSGSLFRLDQRAQVK